MSVKDNKPTDPIPLSTAVGRRGRKLLGVYMHPDQSIKEQAMARGWGILQLDQFFGKVPEGMILQGVLTSKLPDDHSLKALQASGYPCVRLGRLVHPLDHTLPAVLPDEMARAQLAAEHFAECNLNHVCHYANIPWQEGGENFCETFREHAEGLGMTCHLGRFDVRDETKAETLERRPKEFIAWLKTLPKPVGLFVPNPPRALQFAAYIGLANLKIPEEVAILAAHDDYSLCDYNIPTVSYIDSNREGRIKAAFDLLDQLTAGEPAPKKPIFVPPKGGVRNETTNIWVTSDPKVARALRFLWNNLDVDMPVQDIADEVELSARQLNRLFKKSLGRSVSQELQRKRLEEVERLLRTTDLPIVSLASLTGFSSDEYLCKVFSATFGLPPGQYRMANK